MLIAESQHTSEIAESESGEGVEYEAWMQKRLHDLCQPLTALQCRLFLATMVKEPEGELEELREAVRESLVQCERMIGQIRVMQYGPAQGQG